MTRKHNRSAFPIASDFQASKRLEIVHGDIWPDSTINIRWKKVVPLNF